MIFDLVLRFRHSVLVALFVGSFVPAAQGVECHPIQNTDLQGEVCIQKADRSRNPDVLYFFHGVDRNARDWFERGDFLRIQESWSHVGKGNPTVISVSFGPRFILKTEPHNGKGMHEIFVRQIMPDVENEIGGLGGGRRLLLGESMGGLNASILFIREQKLFNRAAFLCAALTKVSPFASSFDIFRYVTRTGANGPMVWYFMGVARDMIGRPQDWSPNDPLDMATHMVGPETPPVYLSSSESDDFGFFEGGQHLANLMKEKGVNTQWVPRQGEHCANHDGDSLIKFFAEP